MAIVGSQNVKGDGVLLSRVGVRLLAQLGAVLEMELSLGVLVPGWVDGQVRSSQLDIVRKFVANIRSTQACYLQVRINRMVSHKLHSLFLMTMHPQLKPRHGLWAMMLAGRVSPRGGGSSPRGARSAWVGQPAEAAT